ncbi:hypothetical protein LTR96_011313 [Exophiala xenobiotica]|nr:hypothetical protein LTR41_011194 [Exophiala xenobiotica]KAK5215360.1 hypothetical protein LTR72_011582 [Exophiala xenobiotica]KAK5220365.1 hypothetical protein LTR47_011198 [Exophiala xenobiotica]KAK5242781.1 hypothetical protein LTS06_011297 [Exophiala xenobiotica]KAK5260989.1 hypothetical protein LTR40_003092 [Exophiala xenobiotica]
MLESATGRLDRSDSSARVEVANVKAIDVSPPALLPTNESNRGNKKRVDYTICYKLPDKRKVVKTLSRYGTHSFTQSNHGRLWNRILFSHVEVKRRRSPKDGESQLAVWTAAGFKKLQEIRDWHRQTNWTRPAAQPLWLWEDDELKLYVALMEASDEMVIYPLAEWQLKQDAQLVSALICITKVMQWAVREYLPWYKILVGYVDDDEDAVKGHTSADAGGAVETAAK